ncbi:ABC transporter ATP-binding protein [Glaesserella parasuis]|nr:ABC transporter ATP-binding protein [Glaesserella parasuis]MDO9977884.1 ABC transporter ATP-binding protein [Glaesserella parasuis]MDP0209459.1 ABC transporter ATP-binding protein [Glaesserella parasuis]
MVLNVNNVAIGYPYSTGITPILQNTSFNVEQGQLTSILGASGVGKSSLLRVLAGLDKSIEGNVTLFGQPVKQPLAEIGYVFQSPTLLPWLTVAENVAFGLDFVCQGQLAKNEIKRRVAEALADVALSDVANVRPNALSGGMAQRVNLARALARNPKLILLDEPFSALDPITRSQMQQILHHIVKQRQATAVMITHDIDEALTVSDHILLLSGKPATIKGKWHLPYAFPRTDLLALNHYRVDILQQMQATPQNNIEYLI